MFAAYVSGSGRWKDAQIDGRLFAVQFDKIDQHQPVRRLTIFVGSANRALSSGSAIRARSLAFPLLGSGNNSRLGSLDSPGLGGVERRNTDWNTPPSIGSSNRRPQLPQAGVV